MLLGGPLTAVPLWLFTFGARRVRYSTVGVVQDIGPSLQLVVAVLVSASRSRPHARSGFGLVWLALAVYAGDGFVRSSTAR